MTGMAFDSTELRTIRDASDHSTASFIAERPMMHDDTDPVANAGALIDELASLDPAEAAEPASRIAEILGAALDEEDR